MAKKRTKAQRAAAAKAAWERRKQGLGPLYRRKGKKKSRTQARTNVEIDIETNAALLDAGVLFPQVDGYAALLQELSHAYLQSAKGKGVERHANGRPFDRQPIMEIGRMMGPGYATGQAAKKAQEALGMRSRGEKDRAIAELHGAIVYLSAAAALIREE